MLTRGNVIAVTFPEKANAYEALVRLKELDSEGTVGVRGAAVVAREHDGRITIKDQLGGDSFEDTLGSGSQARPRMTARPAGRRSDRGPDRLMFDDDDDYTRSVREGLWEVFCGPVAGSTAAADRAASRDLPEQSYVICHRIR